MWVCSKLGRTLTHENSGVKIVLSKIRRKFSRKFGSIIKAEISALTISPGKIAEPKQADFSPFIFTGEVIQELNLKRCEGSTGGKFRVGLSIRMTSFDYGQEKSPGMSQSRNNLMQYEVFPLMHLEAPVKN